MRIYVTVDCMYEGYVTWYPGCSSDKIFYKFLARLKFPHSLHMCRRARMPPGTPNSHSNDFHWRKGRADPLAAFRPLSMRSIQYSIRHGGFMAWVLGVQTA